MLRTTTRRRRAERALRPLAALLGLAALAACVSARSIREPVPGAVERTLPDSAPRVLDAAITAITDEGIDVGMIDRDAGLVESAWIDIGAVRSSTYGERHTGVERTVRFRFRTRRVLGGTVLVGEAVYQPLGQEGRATERMVPRDHAAREVLARMLESVVTRLERARGAAEPGGAR